jgi:hypothetical protein
MWEVPGKVQRLHADVAHLDNHVARGGFRQVNVMPRQLQIDSALLERDRRLQFLRIGDRIAAITDGHASSFVHG